MPHRRLDTTLVHSTKCKGHLFGEQNGTTTIFSCDKCKQEVGRGLYRDQPNQFLTKAYRNAERERKHLLKEVDDS